MKYLRYCDIKKCFIKYRILKMIKTNKIFEGLNKYFIEDYVFLKMVIFNALTNVFKQRIF